MEFKPNIVEMFIYKLFIVSSTMVFVRLKHIKTKDGTYYSYIYLVKNIWTKKGSRQKVIAYLGKAEGYEPFVAQAVLEKDGARCKRCGRQDTLTIDHINPTSNGGKNNIENLQILCQRCNKRKGNKI